MIQGMKKKSKRVNSISEWNLRHPDTGARNDASMKPWTKKEIKKLSKMGIGARNDMSLI